MFSEPPTFPYLSIRDRAILLQAAMSRFISLVEKTVTTTEGWNKVLVNTYRKEVVIKGKDYLCKEEKENIEELAYLTLGCKKVVFSERRNMSTVILDQVTDSNPIYKESCDYGQREYAPMISLAQFLSRLENKAGMNRKEILDMPLGAELIDAIGRSILSGFQSKFIEAYTTESAMEVEEVAQEVTRKKRTLKATQEGQESQPKKQRRNRKAKDSAQVSSVVDVTVDNEAGSKPYNMRFPVNSYQAVGSDKDGSRDFVGSLKSAMRLCDPVVCLPMIINGTVNQNWWNNLLSRSYPKMKQEDKATAFVEAAIIWNSELH